MAFKEQKSTEALKLTDYPNKPFEAYFLGSKEVQTKFGEQWLHEFEMPDGKKFQVWGFTALNRLLEQTPKGYYCKVTYTGKSKEKNKYGNQSHTCTLFFDEDKKKEGVVDDAPDVVFNQDNNQDLPF